MTNGAVSLTSSQANAAARRPTLLARRVMGSHLPVIAFAAAAAVAMVLLLAGCGDFAAAAEPQREVDAKPTHSFVMSAMTVEGAPGLDLDADSRRRVDNKMGSLLQLVDDVFGSPTAQERVDAEMAAGTLALDVVMRADSVADDDLVAIDLGLPGEVGVTGRTLGRLAQRRFTTTLPGEAPVRIALLPGFEPVSVHLYGVRIDASFGPDGVLSGTIGGAISATELREHVIPAIHVLVARYVQVHPTAQQTEHLLQLFDRNKDGAIDADEFSASSFVQVLTSPDVDLLDDDALPALHYGHDGRPDGLSVGFRFQASPR